MKSSTTVLSLLAELWYDAQNNDGKTLKDRLEKDDEMIANTANQIYQLIEKEVIDPNGAKKIDKGNEAYYDQAEGFRLGWGMATAQMEHNLKRLFSKDLGDTHLCVSKIDETICLECGRGSGDE